MSRKSVYQRRCVFLTTAQARALWEYLDRALMDYEKAHGMSGATYELLNRTWAAFNPSTNVSKKYKGFHWAPDTATARVALRTAELAVDELMAEGAKAAQQSMAGYGRLQIYHGTRFKQLREDVARMKDITVRLSLQAGVEDPDAPEEDEDE